MFGTFVVMLLIVWITSRSESVADLGPDISISKAAIGRDELGTEPLDGFAPLGDDEVEELLDLTLRDSIEAVTAAATIVAASFNTDQTESIANAVGLNSGHRQPGPDGLLLSEGRNLVPRFERWELNFTAGDLAGYAGQLDHYGIELGAIGGNIQGLDIVSSFVSTPQGRRLADPSTEKRLYFMFKRSSPLIEYDRALLRQAGVLADGRSMLKLIPKSLENDLARIELQHARSFGYSTAAEIAKTVFESRPSPTGFQFEVVAQRYQSSIR